MLQQRGTLQRGATRHASALALPAPALPLGPRAAGHHRTRQRGPSCAATPQDGRAGGLVERLASSGLGALTALSLLCASPAGAEVIKLPASSNPEVFAAQRVMVEAWEIVKEACVFLTDSTQWPDELRKHMVAAYNQSDGGQPEKAWEEINAMLAHLGDPYTRRIDAEEFQTFQVSTDGELKKGIGLMLAKEPSPSGHLQVLAPIKGGPSDRAGILPGDEVVSINGQDTAGWSGDHAASVLRGQGGSEVRLRLVRRTEGIPGVPGRPEPREQAAPPVITRDVSLQREAVAISPLYAHVLTAPSTGSASGSRGAASSPAPAVANLNVPSTRLVGYLRLSQFSGNAATEMRRAVTDLKAQGASGFILDLRSNPGGLVRAGVDVAALWLDGNKTVFTVASRDPETQARTTEVQTTETLQPALTHDPLVVLVDGMSASASEIVSGALHDHGRALVMGDTASYGKGRIQSVFELQDGSALFVTVATYLTPSGYDIDLKGIRPDLGCRPGSLGVRAAPDLRDGARARPPMPQRNALGMPLAPQRVQQQQQQHGTLTVVPPDPIVARAPAARGTLQPLVAQAQVAQQQQQQPELEPTGFVPGVPVDASTESLLLEALSKDRCVLAAEEYLDAASGASPAAEQEVTRRVLTPAQQLYLAYINMNRPKAWW